MQHRFAIFQHVGDAGGRARIVFQHHELVFGRAHEVDADDVAVDAARRVDPHHLRHESRILDDELFRHDTGFENFLAMVNVVHEGVEGAHPLLDACFEAAPFLGRDDARQDIERDQPFDRIVRPIDGEGDAGAAEQNFGLRRLGLQSFHTLHAEPLGELAVRQPDALTAVTVHFIERLHLVLSLTSNDCEVSSQRLGQVRRP